MIALILFAIACVIEGLMDRLYEVYKLGVIQFKCELKNANWFSYNPLEAEKGLGISRDAWHCLKGIHYLLIIIAIASFDFEPFFKMEWYSMIAALMVIRGVFFNLSLIIARQKINVQNNFRESKD